MRRPKIVWFVVFSAIAVGLSSWRLYYIQSPPNKAHLLWNDTEAFILIGTSDFGWMTTPLGLAGALVFPASAWTPPTRQRVRSVVIRYGRDGVRTFVQSKLLIGTYVFLDGHLFGPAGRWTGEGFEPAELIERQRYDQLLKSRDWTSSTHSGWQERSDIFSDGARRTVHAMKIGGQELQIVVNAPNAFDRTIEVVRGNSSPEVIWTLSGWPRRISAKEYDAVFGHATD